MANGLSRLRVAWDYGCCFSVRGGEKVPSREEFSSRVTVAREHMR